MISDTIKTLRERANMSQAALAKKLDVTRSSVNAWEMGLSTPTTQYVVGIAKLFQYPLIICLEWKLRQVLF